MNHEEKISLLKNLVKITYSKSSGLYHLHLYQTIKQTVNIFNVNWSENDQNFTEEQSIVSSIIKKFSSISLTEKITFELFATEEVLMYKCLNFLESTNQAEFLLNSLNAKLYEPYLKYEADYKDWINKINYLDLNDKLTAEYHSIPSLVNLSATSIAKENDFACFPIEQLSISLKQFGLEKDNEIVSNIHNKIRQDISETYAGLLIKDNNNSELTENSNNETILSQTFL